MAHFTINLLSMGCTVIRFMIIRSLQILGQPSGHAQNLTMIIL